MHVPRPEPKPTRVPIEEADELRAAIVRLTKENDESHQRLCKVTEEKDEFKYKFHQIKEEFTIIQENASKETGKIQRVKYDLETLGSKLIIRNKQLQKVVDVNKEWEAWWKMVAEHRRLMKEGFEARIPNLANSL